MKLYASGPPRYCLCEGRADVLRTLAAWRELARLEGGALREGPPGRYSVIGADGALLLMLELAYT